MCVWMGVCHVCMDGCVDCKLLFLFQARNYLQALPYKPTVPWSRLFPKAGPKGDQYIVYV